MAMLTSHQFAVHHATIFPMLTPPSALAQESLLHYLPNRGYQVPRFTMDDIVQAYEVRGTLEGAAARMLGLLVGATLA